MAAAGESPGSSVVGQSLLLETQFQIDLERDCRGKPDRLVVLDRLTLKLKLLHAEVTRSTGQE